MKVSLVVATFGRADALARLIDSLAAQTSTHFELLVIDQNPDDRLLPYIEQARQAQLAVKHLRLAKPSLSGARNLGIAEATGDVIAFPDDDCWYAPDLVEQVQAAFQQHPTWDALVAQWVEQAEGMARPTAGGQTLSAAAWRQFRGGEASSISLFARASALQRHGGFDERLGVGQWFGAGEETDLLLRMLCGGALVGQWPSARVHHRFVLQALARPQAQWRSVLHRARGTGAIYAKHRLSGWVFLRGLLSPVAKALWQRQGLRALALALVETFGRLQGACAWFVGR